ncbi:MAG: hypothetical protein QOF59_1546 [Actinomycetota bacterium]|jgi:hypothetical protein|nr:hypothetical protein [Actinomycetota bacterium]
MGHVRMMVDTDAGVRMVAGNLIDLSEGGCSIFVKSRVEPNSAARMQVEISGVDTAEKERAIRALVWERRNLVKS